MSRQPQEAVIFGGVPLAPHHHSGVGLDLFGHYAGDAGPFRALLVRGELRLQAHGLARVAKVPG